jgi:hypothetical protein
MEKQGVKSIQDVYQCIKSSEYQDVYQCIKSSYHKTIQIKKRILENIFARTSMIEFFLIDEQVQRTLKPYIKVFNHLSNSRSKKNIFARISIYFQNDKTCQV